jgi:hypothetical protein
MLWPTGDLPGVLTGVGGNLNLLYINFEFAAESVDNLLP